MYQIKVFGPNTMAEVESKVNFFLQYTNLRLLDTKTRVDESGCVMTLVLATPRPYEERLTVVLDCQAGSANITACLAGFKQSCANLKKIEDVVILPASADHSSLYLKVIYTLHKGSNNFENKANSR